MKKESKKIIISFLFLLLLFISVFYLTFPLKTSAQEQQLEVAYPEISGVQPETTRIGIVSYVKYIFNFVIAITGLIAFGALVFGGIRYLTSAGNAEELKKAKKQIKSAFLGVIILLFSYLILTTVNPQLIIFKIPALIEIPAPDISVIPENKPSTDLTPLERINEIAQNLKIVNEGIEYYAQEIKSLTDDCDCGTTQPMCLCEEYQKGDCGAQYCYSAEPDQPCPDDQKIKEDQKKIVAFGDEIAYYKNRIEAEAQDLKVELEKVINEKIKWYEERIAAEKKVLEQAKEGSAKDLEQEIIRSLEEGKVRLEVEKDYKESLRSKLIETANTIEKIKKPIATLAALPDQCLTNVRDKCSGSCSGGCHDALGCFPVECFGGNPCPVTEIQSKADEINSISQEIKKIVDEIIALQPKIKEAETTKKEVCDTPQNLAKDNNEPYPSKRASSLESLLSCISKGIGQPLPSEGNANQYYGSLYTYEHQNESCNYTRGKEICGSCSHTVNSCHYGGASGSSGALAADFGNEKNGDKIIQAALNCGAKSARCENSSGKTVVCSDSSADHVHIDDRSCDRN